MSSNHHQSPSHSIPKPQKRSIQTLLIEPFRQIKLGLYVVLSSLLFIGLASYLVFGAFKEQYEHIMTLFNVVDPEAQWSLIVNEVFIRNAIKISTLFGGYLLFLLVMVFRLTHRYYGPLVAIERFLGELQRGNYSARVSVRRKDELQGLVTQLNQLAEGLQHSRKASCGCGPDCVCCKKGA